MLPKGMKRHRDEWALQPTTGFPCTCGKEQQKGGTLSSRTPSARGGRTELTGGTRLRGYRVCIGVGFQESRFLKCMQTTKRVPSVFHVVYPPLFLSSHFLKNTHLNYHGFQLLSQISLHLQSSIQFTIKIRYIAFPVCLFKEKLIGPTPKLTVMYPNVILLINNSLTKVRFQGCLCEHKQD